MRNIYTGIDIGSDNIKIVVAELIKDKFYVLASTSVKSVGVKRGLVVDEEMATNSLRLAINEIEKTLGVRINKAIVAVPSNSRNLSIVDGTINIYNDVINGNDIVTLLQESTIDKIDSNDELVSLIPIMFCIDNDKFTIDPKGVKASSLSVKALMATAPKEQILNILKIFSNVSV